MIVVTGASGHIGANLCRTLIAAGKRVRALIHTDGLGLDDTGVEQLRGDVLDPASLRAAFDGAEVVYHLAARIALVRAEDEKVREVNVRGTQNVVAACLDRSVKRLVHFSSIHAFCQDPLQEPLNESRAQSLTPQALPYDRSKAEGEREVQAGVKKGLDAVIVNPTAVVGPHDYRPSHMGQVLLDLHARKLPALVEGGFDWVDVRDVVHGAMAACERGRTGERYLLGGAWCSLKGLAKEAAQVTGVPAPRFVVPMAVCRLAAPPAALVSQLLGKRPLFTSDSLTALRANRNVRTDKAGAELGYKPRPLSETLRDSYDWFRSAGRI